jgi:hypothetical protein
MQPDLQRRVHPLRGQNALAELEHERAIKRALRAQRAAERPVCCAVLSAFSVSIATSAIASKANWPRYGRIETAAAVRRKAALLAEYGYDDVAITAPDGQRYPPQVFDQLRSDIDWSERRH